MWNRQVFVLGECDLQIRDLLGFERVKIREVRFWRGK